MLEFKPWAKRSGLELHPHLQVMCTWGIPMRLILTTFSRKSTVENLSYASTIRTLTVTWLTPKKKYTSYGTGWDFPGTKVRMLEGRLHRIDNPRGEKDTR